MIRDTNGVHTQREIRTNASERRARAAQRGCTGAIYIGTQDNG